MARLGGTHTFGLRENKSVNPALVTGRSFDLRFYFWFLVLRIHKNTGAPTLESRKLRRTETFTRGQRLDEVRGTQTASGVLEESHRVMQDFTCVPRLPTHASVTQRKTLEGEGYVHCQELIFPLSSLYRLAVGSETVSRVRQKASVCV